MRRWILLGAALAACSPEARSVGPDGGTGPFADARLETTATRLVPVTGGVIAIDGMTLTIPPGALVAATTITVTRISDTPPDGYGSISALYRIEPIDALLVGTVTASVQQDRIILHPALWVHAGDAFDAVDGDSQDGVVTAELRSFGDVFIGRSLARLRITPGQVDLGETDVGSELYQQFSVTNLGGMITESLAVTVGGPDADDVNAVTGTCDKLAPDNVCFVRVYFTPSNQGRHSATIAIGPTIGNQNTATLTATGLRGLEGWITPSPVAFPNVKVGSESAPLGVTLTNYGSTTIGKPVISLRNGVNATDAFAFRVFLDACAAPLAPGESCSAYVVARPARVGALAALLRFETTGGGSGAVLLTATGTPSE